MLLLSKRLKEARENAELTQQKLGILAGIKEDVSSQRMNQYERGKRVPDFLTLKNIANVLRLPLSYFYSEDDDEAYLVKTFFRMTKQQKKEALNFFKSKQPPGGG